MAVLVLCGVLVLFSSAQKDACDDERTPAECNSNPKICYWDSSKEEVGHACVKFTGDCTTIVTNISEECSGAGMGLLCDYVGSLCLGKCNLFNSTTCNSHDGCWFSITLDRCQKCDEINAPNDCNSASLCRWNSSNRCQYDNCRTLYPGNYQITSYSSCGANTSCYVLNTGDCQDFFGCGSIRSAYSCNNGYGHTGCYYDYFGSSNVCRDFINCGSITDNPSCSGRPDCYVDYYSGSSPYPCRQNNYSTCASYTTSGECTNSNSAPCFWDSTISKCSYFSECRDIATNSSSDCTNARVNFTDGRKNCTWENNRGCFSKCSDFPKISGYESECNNSHPDCWWDSGVDQVVNYITYYNGCRNYSNCQNLGTDRDACTVHKKTCYWASGIGGSAGTCSPYTHCSDITTSDECTSASCKWSVSVCVDICTEIKNEYDCRGRLDCNWTSSCRNYPAVSCSGLSDYTDCNNRKNCYYSSSGYCFNWAKCEDIDYSSSCGYLGKGCVWYSNSIGCVPAFLINKSCSVYGSQGLCNRDSSCVWNQGINKCQNFTTCGDISSVNFGGLFNYTYSDCTSKSGCSWKSTSDERSGCSMILGECVKNDTGCAKNLDSVTCDAASGCYWNGGCVQWDCSLFWNESCTSKAQCEWVEGTTSYCVDKCSSYSSNTTCKEKIRCFWNGTNCGVFENCTNVTERYECLHRGAPNDCVWFGTNVTDITVGYCVNESELNKIIRSCNNYKNADQCKADTFNRGVDNLNCVFIWNAAHDGGNCIAANTYYLTNCSVYKNREQCISMYYGNGECYWNSTGGHCQEYIDCSNIPIDDCEFSHSCGVIKGECGYSSCSNRNKMNCTGKCEWDRTSCIMKGSNTDVRISNAQFMLGVGDYYDPCRYYGNFLDCNADKTMCNMGCVYNTQLIGGSSSCSIFRNCSDIKYPIFQNPQKDCDARIPCYWANGACGLDAPKPTNTKKSISTGGIAAIVIVVALVVFVIITVLLVLLYIILKRKKKTGVGEDGSPDQNEDVAPIKGENVPADGSGQEETLVDNEEGKESEVSDL